MSGTVPVEVSVVLPCLDEAEALPSVIPKIRRAFDENGIGGEIVVCDNGSTDGSPRIAESLGARVIHESRRGYGRALLTGFANARGKYLVMGDADDTYDFSLIPQLISPLKSGQADFVTGSRYLSENTAAIPWLHRYVGNPALTGILNFLFGARYTDVYSGLRGFSRESYERIRPVSVGMEFNLELAINTALAGLRVTEIPIRLGERKGVSKLNTFSDGWRSLRMMLLYCPNKVFLWPGTFLGALGLFFLLAPLSPLITYETRRFGVVTGFCGSILCILGFKVISLGLHAKCYSWSRRFDPDNALLTSFFSRFNLEKGLLLGAFMMVIGTAILASQLVMWLRADLLPLSHPEWLPVGTTALVVGAETIFASLFISAMSMPHAGTGER